MTPESGSGISHDGIFDCRRKALLAGMPPDAWLLVVDIPRLQMIVGDGSSTNRIFPVSTSKYGVGEIIDSFKTPRGFHEIVERIGENLPPGAVLVSRCFTGLVLRPDQWIENEGDRILSRILYLSGKTPGLNQGGNVDSYQRMIYLHGTNQEQHVGVRASSDGCIRLRNLDMIELFDMIRDRPAWCWIDASPP